MSEGLVAGDCRRISMKPRFVTSVYFRALLFGVTEGILLAAVVVNVRDALREDEFFRGVASHAVGDKAGDEDRLLALMHKTYRMLEPLRKGIIRGDIEDVSGLDNYRRILFSNVAHDSLFPSGECGSYAGVLVKLLRAENIAARFGQMLDREDVNGVAHHIVVEAWLDGRWVILDPLYDLVFRGDDGRILGYDEIKRDWETLKSQCPPNYDARYDYRGFRRVNFGRLNPWLQKTPLAEWSLRTFLNEGSWLRVALALSVLAFVIAIHAWYERRLTVEQPDRTVQSKIVRSAANMFGDTRKASPEPDASRGLSSSTQR